MKKILFVILAVCLVLSVTACNFNFKTTSTTTTTTTDADGNTTTTTTTSTNENGKVTETTETVTSTKEEAEPAETVTCAMRAEDGEMHSFPYQITNKTQYTLNAFATLPAGGQYTAEDNVLGDNVIAPDSNVHGDFSYNKDELVFDFVFGVGEDTVTFSGVDFSGVNADTELLSIELTENEDGSFHLSW